MPAITVTSEKHVETALSGRFADNLFRWLTRIMVLSVAMTLLIIVWQLVSGSSGALQKFGWKFLVRSDRDPVQEDFGALPLVYGTLVLSAVALIIAVPLSIGTAIFLTDLV